MALSTSTVLEVRSTGNSANGGGFNVGNTNFATDLTATSANTSAPVVSSVSYTFVAGDVGAMVFIKSGTNWTPGFYQIVSVNAGAATLTASIGSVSLYGGTTILNTVAGCATTASPTSGTWGVDYSQQTSAQITFTDMVIDGTTNTKFTSAAFPVGKNYIGNIINITSGTGFTVQRVEVVSTVTTTATCDKSLGTLSSTGGNGKLGGAIDSQATASGFALLGMKVFTTGSFTQTVTATYSVSGTESATQMVLHIIGYSSYRGDNGRATIVLSTNTGLTAIATSSQGVHVSNISVDCASLGTSTGINLGANCKVTNCKVANFTATGINTANAGQHIRGCEVTGGTSAATQGIGPSTNTAYLYYGNYVHDNACPGIILNASAEACDNLVVNNTGASSDGIRVTSVPITLLRNIVYGNGRHGINFTSSFIQNQIVQDNILAGNGGYGMVIASSAGTPSRENFDGNAYWNNTSGTRNNADDRGTTNPINGVAPYINVFDVILTLDPFIDKANGDFRLNTTVGGGANCRGFGVPRSWPGNTLTVSAPDMGAIQHLDSTVSAYFAG